MITAIIEDGFFAAIAAIGFSSISNPPRKAYLICALLAAVGHSLRFTLTHIQTHIIVASFAAAFAIGTLAIPLARRIKCPAEVFSFPALLPMIPGMFAYRTIQALVKCLINKQEEVFNHYLYLLFYNGFTCIVIIIAMVVGVTAPIFIFNRISFQATR